METLVFEIKNGVYNVRQYDVVSNKYGHIELVNPHYEVFFVVFDNRYPEDDYLVLNEAEFNIFRSKKIPYTFGFMPYKDQLSTPKKRCDYIMDHFGMTEKEAYSYSSKVMAN